MYNIGKQVIYLQTATQKLKHYSLGAFPLPFRGIIVYNMLCEVRNGYKNLVNILYYVQFSHAAATRTDFTEGERKLRGCNKP